MRSDPGGGIYMWGFDDHQGEVIWYVGKAISSKGIYRRLCKHYLDVMSGQYQIPHGFLNQGFNDPECSKSGWRIERDSDTAEVLKDWTRMKRIFKAGHLFANSAFARVAFLQCADDVLKAIERQAIISLDPEINKQRGDGAAIIIEMQESAEDGGWLEKWRRRRSLTE